jgi:tetratricopeptide (TPR) repeat protein
MNLTTEIILDKLRPIREQGFPKMYSGEEYVELVQSLGVSEQEWGQLQEGFYEYLQNGKKQLKENELEDALTNLEKALLIRPDNIDTLSAISEIHLRAWQSRGDTHSFEKADYFVNRCLLLAPEHEASQTRLAMLHPKVRVNASPNKMGMVILIAGFLIAMAVGLLVFFVMKADAVGPGVHY